MPTGPPGAPQPLSLRDHCRFATAVASVKASQAFTPSEGGISKRAKHAWGGTPKDENAPPLGQGGGAAASGCCRGGSKAVRVWESKRWC